MNGQQRLAATRLIRLAGAGLRGDVEVAEPLFEATKRCHAVSLPDYFRLAGMAVYRQLACPGLCNEGASCPWRVTCDTIEELRVTNTGALGRVVEYLQEEKLVNGEPPMLLGDMAVLLGLYRELGAYRGTLWVLGVPGYDDGGEHRSAAVLAVSASPSEVRIGRRGRLRNFVADHTVEAQVAGSVWRVPVEELLVTLLAARVGEPESTPLPPVWAHLALALAARGDTIDFGSVLAMAEELELSECVHRGLAVVGSMMPELRTWIPMDALEIPAWERWLAVPISARRLMSAAVGE